MTKFKVNTPETAPETSKQILNDVQKTMGFIPNLFGVFAENSEVLKSYLALSDSLSKSGLTPIEQQIVALTVSRENNCNYCMAAHSAISAMNKFDVGVIENVRGGTSISDKKLEALHQFTKSVVSERGLVSQDKVESFLKAGYTNSHVLAVILGVAMKTLSNYTNHLANTPVDEAFSQFLWTKK